MSIDELGFESEITIPEELYNSFKNTEYNINDITQIIENINGAETLNKLKGLIGLNKLYLLEIKKEEPNQIFNDINTLFNLLENYPEKFKSECFKILTSIEHINFTIEKFIKNEPTDKIVKIILFIFSFPEKFKLDLLLADLDYVNIITNDKNIIKKLGTENLYEKIKKLIKNEGYSQNELIINICIKILSKIFENDNEINKNKGIILDFIPIIAYLMNNFKGNKDIIAFELQILYKVTNTNVDENSPIVKDIMDKIIEMNLLPKIMDIIDKSDINFDQNQILFSLRILGNFVAMENSYYTDKVIECNILDELKKLMEPQYSFGIRKEASWIISNIAAGTPQQLTKLYENNFQDILFNIILNEDNSKIKENCLWALYNYSNINNPEYLDILVEKGFLDIIIKRFSIDNGDTLGCSLEALAKILMDGKKKDPAMFNIIETKINELDILKELKNLYKNNVENICKSKIEFILNNIFGIKDLNNFISEKEND